ncbi:hypothetical protein L2E82_49952 [Cichorium intybus]|nr:hypothetical protein L2E82_49952 [Cichorium intybus]
MVFFRSAKINIIIATFDLPSLHLLSLQINGDLHETVFLLILHLSLSECSSQLKCSNFTLTALSDSNLKFWNPKYLSIMIHLRFYLPEIFPNLSKVVFLDDDIVVQKKQTKTLKN